MCVEVLALALLAGAAVSTFVVGGGRSWAVLALNDGLSVVGGILLALAMPFRRQSLVRGLAPVEPARPWIPGFFRALLSMVPWLLFVAAFCAISLGHDARQPPLAVLLAWGLATLHETALQRTGLVRRMALVRARRFARRSPGGCLVRGTIEGGALVGDDGRRHAVDWDKAAWPGRRMRTEDGMRVEVIGLGTATPDLAATKMERGAPPEVTRLGPSGRRPVLVTPLGGRLASR